MARLPAMALSLGLVLLAASNMATALDVDLCSSFNTADTPRNISRFQSNGLCHDHCISEYAYAVTQWTSCWCTNYTPDEEVQVSGSRCNQDCPGWPDEKCGGDGVYAYLLLNDVLPSGTRGPEPDEATSTTTTQQSETSSTGRSSTTEPTTSLPTSSFIQTISTAGTVVTVTVTPPQATGGEEDPSGSADGGQSSGTSDGGGLGTGAIVGIVVGVIGAVLLAAGLALFWFFRRRRRNQQDEGFRDDPSVKSSTSPGVTPNSRSEMTVAAGTPMSPASATRRNSTLQIDPRMDPFKQGLYTRSHSHESVNTIHDDHDYSRRIQPTKVLRATNPDPTD